MIVVSYVVWGDMHDAVACTDSMMYDGKCRGVHRYNLCVIYSLRCEMRDKPMGLLGL